MTIKISQLDDEDIERMLAGQDEQVDMDYALDSINNTNIDDNIEDYKAMQQIGREGLIKMVESLSPKELNLVAYALQVPASKVIPLLNSKHLTIQPDLIKLVYILNKEYAPAEDTPDTFEDLMNTPMNPEVKDIKASMNKKAIAKPRYFFMAGKDKDNNAIIRIAPDFVAVWDKYEALGKIPTYKDKKSGMLGKWAGNKDKLVPMSDLHNLVAAWNEIANSQEAAADLESHPDAEEIKRWDGSLADALKNNADELILRAKDKGVKKMSTRKMRKIKMIEAEYRRDERLDPEDIDNLESGSSLADNELDERELQRRKLLKMRKELFNKEDRI